MDSKDKLVTLEDLKVVHDEVARYTTCSTAASTAAKTAALTNFVLTTGSCVRVKFTNSNTAANPTLNVNSTGAKPIMQYGATAVGVTPLTSWDAGAVVSFIYDGTNWVIMNGSTEGSSIGTLSNLTTTAKTDLVSAINEIDLENATEIPTNADLDDYATAGAYYCPSGTQTATLVNCPTTTNFVMLVLKKGSYWSQLLFTGANIHTRTRTTTGYGGWNRFANAAGDTFTGDVIINDASSTTSSEVSLLTLGNSTATGTVGNSNGLVRMYGQGDKYLNLRPVTTSGTYTSSNRTIYLPDAGGTVQLVEDHTVSEGSRVTTNVPNETTTTIATLSLGSGKWVVVGGFEFSSSFTQGTVAVLLSGSSQVCGVRGTGANGGGWNMTSIETVSSSTTISLQAYQGSGSAKTVKNIMLRAIKIA